MSSHSREHFFPLPFPDCHLLIHVLLCVRLKITYIQLCIHPTNPLSCMFLYIFYFSCSVSLSLENCPLLIHAVQVNY